MGFEFAIKFYNTKTNETKEETVYESTYDFFNALRSAMEKAIELYQEIWDTTSPNRYWQFVSITYTLAGH